jgi:hypothetical protein
VCWGWNSRGQLGNENGTNNVGDEPGEMGSALKPVKIGIGSALL